MGMERPDLDRDEDRWIRAAQRGDVSAFNQLVERYQTLAFNVAYRTIGNPEDAADATQEAFFSAFRALADFRGGSFKSWLLRIVVNACYDTRRRAQRRPSTSMEALVEEYEEAPWSDPLAEDPEGTTLSHEALDTIAGALQQLPDEQRMAIVLVDVQGLSYEEAADVLNCAIGTIRSRLARGRARVRDLLVASGNFP
jgi:RNA polymerase sigma-70 factor, ECF subfamily